MYIEIGVASLGVLRGRSVRLLNNGEVMSREEQEECEQASELNFDRHGRKCSTKNSTPG